MAFSSPRAVERPLKVLVSAYACEPDRGSEPGVGWNVARALAERHEVWLITRENNLPPIRRALERRPTSNLHPIGYDLPRWSRWWKRKQRGVRFYYYLWQVGAYFVARRLHAAIDFDVTHHLTFVRYWSPSFLSLLGVPFVWGPVGGGEAAPRAFRSGFGIRGQLYEVARQAGRWFGEHDPFVHLTARRASIALATTPETARRLIWLGARCVRSMSEAGLDGEEIERLGRPRARRDGRVRFLSVGRLLHWKAFHLGLMAFEAASLEQSEYWVLGSGPERTRLEKLAESLGIGDQVHFLGDVPRERVLDALSECDVLVHPSLHDSGGWVCLEAMAAGVPVVCMDLGGPATQVTEETGVKVSAESVKVAVTGIAEAMSTLAGDSELRRRLGLAGRELVAQRYSWGQRAEAIADLYSEAAAQGVAPKAPCVEPSG